MRCNRYGFTSQEIVRQCRRQFRDHGRAARAARQLAADRRHRPLRAGAAALRHAGRRRDAHRREAPMPAISAGPAHDPLAALAARRRCCSAASCISRRCCCCRAPRRRTPIRGSPPIDAGQYRRAAAARRRRTMRVMPFMDPAFAIAVCRYDLSAGPLKLARAGEPGLYVGVVLYPQRRRLLRDQRSRRRAGA